MPVFRLTEEILFPRPSLAEENGLLAIGGDLSPARIISAYRLGIFPWYSREDPILWWFTSPRLVLFPDTFTIPKRLARYMRKPLFTVTYDAAFERVIESCAAVRTMKSEETWITEEMQAAYVQLHRLGYAHSVECWQGHTLAGGLYGVLLDRVFFGESMFTLASNGSKIALASLAAQLRRKGCRLIDCQMTTEHLLQYGAREISGREFRKLLEKYIEKVTPDGKWSDEPDK